MFNRTRLAAAVSAAFGVGLIAAAPATSLAQAQMDRVEITGSSIKRIEGETALPVQVITREDIQKTGASNVEQLMQTVSANASSGQLVGASASGATTLGLSGLSLRGLNSTRTLVLVNGRRVSPYGYGFTNDSVSVDVNSIPLDAIERVEILKDGASAIYGSDAIAGVVNFILRKDFKGVEISAEYGAGRENSAGSTRASLSWGMGDLAKDRYNVMVVGSYSREKALFGRDQAIVFVQGEILAQRCENDDDRCADHGGNPHRRENVRQHPNQRNADDSRTHDEQWQQPQRGLAAPLPPKVLIRLCVPHIRTVPHANRNERKREIEPRPVPPRVHCVGGIPNHP